MLTQQQKKLLVKVLRENEPTPNEREFFGNVNLVSSVYSLPDEILVELEKLGDYETLHQDVNRFINDFNFNYLKTN